VGRRGALIGPRVVVGGISGSGKSTLAAELARRLGAPHVELDAHFHKPGWQESTDEEFTASVSAAVAGDRWVVDGNYTRVREVTWARATTFVWLDYARPVATLRTVRRTARRLATRQELWNGNRERWSNLLDAGHPIRWSWTQHPGCRAKYEAAVADPRWAHVEVVRLRSPRATASWLKSVSFPPDGPEVT
jgi:adenylate kinase family enzyme